MNYLIIIIIVGIFIFILRNIEIIKDNLTIFNKFSSNKPQKIHHSELMKVLLGLSEESLEKLLGLYKENFGAGAARYARKTCRKWEAGEVRPVKQTFERF